MFLRLLVLAIPAYVVAIAAGMAYARYWGWSVDDAQQTASEHSMIVLLRWIVWAIALFVLSGWVERALARRRAARLPTVIILGGSPGPVKRPPGLFSDTIRFVGFVALCLLGFLAYLQWRRG